MYQVKFYEAKFKKRCYFPQRNINVFDINTAAIIKFVNRNCEIIFYDPSLGWGAKPSSLHGEPEDPYSDTMFLESIDPPLLLMDVALQNIQYIPLYNFPTKYTILEQAEYNQIDEIPFDEETFMKYTNEKIEYLHTYVKQEIGDHRYNVFLPNYIRNYPEKLDFESLIEDKRFCGLECDAICDVILNEKYPIEYRKQLYEIIIKNPSLKSMANSALIFKIENEVNK